MSDTQPKVLYIAGAGRSGSTILHNVLGQIDGFVAVGELRYVWERGVIDNRLCGCGVPFRSCDFWQRVFRAAYGGFDNIDADEMHRQTESFHLHHLPTLLLPNLREKRLARLHSYLDQQVKLYQAIQSVTGCRVIVDSSKNPAYGYLLHQMTALDLFVLHLVRDSRAVTYSWSTKKPFQPDPANPDFMTQKGAFSSSLQWNARNLGAERLLSNLSKHHLLVRYEDFLKSPAGSLTQILRLVDENAAELPFVTANTVNLATPNHSVFGNLVRFQTGVVELRQDERWRTQMKRHNKLFTTVLTSPLLLRYGYLSRAHKTLSSGLAQQGG
jgi:hypothetical protein